jgi:hypothetical protein
VVFAALGRNFDAWALSILVSPVSRKGDTEEDQSCGASPLRVRNRFKRHPVPFLSVRVDRGISEIAHAAELVRLCRNSVSIVNRDLG